MILPIRNINSNVRFSADNSSPDEGLDNDILLKNSIGYRTKNSINRFTNAMTSYTKKGFTGSKNANFHEFLSMGTIPYIVGSGMLMAMFNMANRFYSHFDRTAAGKIGKPLALGVAFYGIAKELSKNLITKPVKWLTGVDTELPYRTVVYELPDFLGDTDLKTIEDHKVFESADFPRWDLLYGDESKGEVRNAYYDKVAKKLGMGSDLNDSDQEVKPRIREIVVKTNTAKNLSSYLWAATGVALAVQEPFQKFFNKPRFKTFGVSFKNACVSLFTGEGSKIGKHSGKALIATSIVASVAGVLNVVNSSQKLSKIDSSNVIKKDEKYVVS